MTSGESSRARLPPGRADAYLAAIVESSIDAIKAKTLDGTIVFWNAATERMYGYTADEAIGRNVSFVIPPERPNELPEVLSRIAAGERIEHYETERVRKDGTRIDVSISVSPVRDETGAIVGAATIARDITDRKRVQQGQNLLATASRLLGEAYLEPDAIVDGVCAAATEAIADDCLIYLREDGGPLRLAAARGVRLGVGDQVAERVVAAVEPVLVRGLDPASVADELGAAPPSQPPQPGLHSLLGVPLRAYGRAVGAIVLARRRAGRPFVEQDIPFVQELADRAAMALDAARVRADERRARREAEELAAITRQLGRSLSLETVLDEVAAAASELLGAPVSGVFLLDTLGERFDLVAGRGLPLDRADLSLPRSASLAGRVVAAGRAEVVPDASQAGVTALPALVSGAAVGSLLVAPIGTVEAPQGVVEVYAPRIDAFRRRDADLLGVLADAAAAAIANARLYQESQRAVRAREEFLHVAAHELRGPITGLRGYAQMTLRQLDRGAAPDPGRLRAALSRVDEQSRRLTLLVDRLLDVTRLAGGRLQIERRPTDIAALARQAAESIRARYADLLFMVHAPRPVVANVDPIRIEQVLTNLLDNAAKFSPPGTPVDVDVTRAGDVARIAVRDRGPGVAPEARVRIFDRFEQAHAERHHGGLGLGLYISRQLVELHGGAIAYEAPSDGGARFVVQLPLAEPTTAASPGAGPVLVVDDDDTIRSLMAEALSDEGYETVEAKDGAVALDFVRAYSPRLILLDMRMPGMNGWEFAEEYRKLPGPHAPIVVVTAGADGALKASQIHADAYVAKPFRIDDLVDTVARHLQTIA